MAQILDTNGAAIFLDEPITEWLGSFNIRHTAADAAGSYVLAITNPSGSGKYLYFTNVRGEMAFDGTAVAATSLAYEFVRYSSAVTPLPTTGTSLTYTFKDKRRTATFMVAANAQYKSGVLTLGPTTVESFFFVRLPASVTNGVIEFDFDLSIIGKKRKPIIIGPNEGFGIRLTNAAIIGQGLSGHVEVDERAA